MDKITKQFTEQQILVCEALVDVENKCLAMIERVAILESENAALQREVTTLRHRVTEAPTADERRMIFNGLRELSMQQRGMTEALLPNVADFEHTVSLLIGQPAMHAPERFKEPPATPTKR